MTMICQHYRRALHCETCGQELPKRVACVKLHTGGGLWVSDYVLRDGEILGMQFSAIEARAAEMSISHAVKIACHFDNSLKIKAVEI